MLQKALFAEAQFITLPIRNRHLTLLLCDAIPKVLDQLETFRSSEFEKRRKFLVYERTISFLLNLFKSAAFGTVISR